MTGGGSVVVRRQLGSKLRALRSAAGKDVVDVTEAGLGSKAKISRIETGKGPVRVADVRALCWLYGVDAPTTDALAALAPGTQQDGWQEEYGPAVVPDWFGLRAGLEATASRIRCFEPVIVHGLVQTLDYATAVIRTDPRLAPNVVEQRARFRMERQRRLAAGDQPASALVVVGESALRMVAGSPAIMAAQVAYLRSPDAHPHVDVRVLPFAAGPWPPRGSFDLLDFVDDEDPSVAYVELPFGARYFDRPEDRAEYEFVFDLVAAKAIPINDWSPA
ncbi:MAG: helix-turn-helix domain-containing protein [Pseudonocardia sp.]|nr:helix-turn-helix domain-containing protein [Pseudonocardia sp.]